jgi:hypothetical protein
MARVRIDGAERSVSDSAAARLVHREIAGKGELTEAQILHTMKSAGVEFVTRLRSCLAESHGLVTKTARGKWQAQ